ncbi:MAG: Holliday junction resolvase RuvX [Clostridia bacterium]|nr:Holliday junction resolvase RuvX [Clostridia bacterium]
MKYIAFDIGDKRVGVAVSDPFCQMALPLETYHRKNFNKDIEYLAKLASDKFASVIVCGLPLNFDGSESEQTLKTKSFVEELKKHTEIPIVFQDERFTTKEARRLLLEADMRRENRKNVIDMVAASYILETYMQTVNNKKEN